MKLTEKNIGELYTTNGKDIYQYMGELTIIVQRMKNLLTGEDMDIGTLDLRAICNDCALKSNCDHAANLQPDGTCKAYDKKS
jgi:hypothetical protein